MKYPFLTKLFLLAIAVGAVLFFWPSGKDNPKPIKSTTPKIEVTLEPTVKPLPPKETPKPIDDLVPTDYPEEVTLNLINKKDLNTNSNLKYIQTGVAQPIDVSPPFPIDNAYESCLPKDVVKIAKHRIRGSIYGDQFDANNGKANVAVRSYYLPDTTASNTDLTYLAENKAYLKCLKDYWLTYLVEKNKVYLNPVLDIKINTLTESQINKGLLIQEVYVVYKDPKLETMRLLILTQVDRDKVRYVTAIVNGMETQAVLKFRDEQLNKLIGILKDKNKLPL